MCYLSLVWYSRCTSPCLSRCACARFASGRLPRCEAGRGLRKVCALCACLPHVTLRYCGGPESRMQETMGRVWSSDADCPPGLRCYRLGAGVGFGPRRMRLRTLQAGLGVHAPRMLREPQPKARDAGCPFTEGAQAKIGKILQKIKSFFPGVAGCVAIGLKQFH